MVDVRITGVAPQATRAGQVRITGVPQQSLSLGDVATGAAENFVPSAKQFGADMLAPFLHPIQTAESLAGLARGVVEFAIPGEQENEQLVRNVGDFFTERYGGLENIKRTAATDPVGFTADLASLLTVGGGAAARAPGIAGQLARATLKAGRAVDPTLLAARAAGAVARPAGNAVASVVGGIGTHTGRRSVQEAAGAGFEGGPRAQAFQRGMRGDVTPTEITGQAMEAMGNLRRQRGNLYRQQIAALGQTPEVVDFADIARAYGQTVDDFSRGTENLLPVKVQRVKTRVDGLLREWAENPQRHTPDQLDILRQDLRDIRDQFKTTRDSRYTFVEKVRQDVGNAIEDAAPTYAGIVQDYAKASDVIDELERTLSLNPNAAVDTQLRKLSSAIRDNVNTNFGERAVLVDLLEEAGAENLQSKLAGMAMADLVPRGLGRAMGGAAVLSGGAGLAGGPLAAVLALAAQSPRVVGEATLAGGRAAGALAPVIRPLPGLPALATFQAGRNENLARRQRNRHGR